MVDNPLKRSKEIYTPEYLAVLERESEKSRAWQAEHEKDPDRYRRSLGSEMRRNFDQRVEMEETSNQAWADGVADGTISTYTEPVVHGNMNSINRQHMSSDRHQHLRGLVVGAAVGDALGAPFEFGPAGAFRDRFPAGSTSNEMVGSSLWDPGEFTDDTQMAIIEAESIVDVGWPDRADMFRRFGQWVASGPKDVGISTRAVLTSSPGWPRAPKQYFEQHPNGSAGNGSLMRSSFAAARWALVGEGSAEVARYLSSVTHADPAAGEGRALFHMLCSQASGFRDLDARMDRFLGFLKDGLREPYERIVASPRGTTMPNGTVWGCFSDAYWAVKRSDSFEEAMYNACDVGGDTDTVAAVAGGLAGVIYGLDEIPERWVEPLHGNVGAQTYRVDDLVELCDQLRYLSIDNANMWDYGTTRTYLPTHTGPPIWDL